MPQAGQSPKDSSAKMNFPAASRGYRKARAMAKTRNRMVLTWCDSKHFCLTLRYYIKRSFYYGT